MDIFCAICAVIKILAWQNSWFTSCEVYKRFHYGHMELIFVSFSFYLFSLLQNFACWNQRLISTYCLQENQPKNVLTHTIVPFIRVPFFKGDLWIWTFIIFALWSHLKCGCYLKLHNSLLDYLQSSGNRTAKVGKNTCRGQVYSRQM